MISRKQDDYQFDLQAEENEDYVNIASVKVQTENEKLKEKIKEQMKQIIALKSQLKNI